MSLRLSTYDREKITSRLSNEQFDVIVIGGGVTGAGIFLDATSRGLKTCMIEMQDFAEGTSSRSTKLIHGGLRYLKQREFKLVKEVGRERTIVQSNAPHLTYKTPVLVPLYKGGSIGKFAARIGMKIYDWLAGVSKEDRHKILSARETLEKEPLLSKEKLKGAIYYPEYRTNDARLTLSIVKKAFELGGLCLNYCKLKGFNYDKKGKIIGVQAEDLYYDKVFDISGLVVINATGPWVDHVCTLDQSTEKKLLLTKGIHIVIDHKKLPIKEACYFDTNDKRMVFAIPNGDKTYIGTTDTIYAGNVSRPPVFIEDVDYLLDNLNRVYGLDLKHTDVESSWSGLRPLIKEKGKSSPSAISRKDEVFHSKSNLISIAGGKLTGYRKMAEKAVGLAIQSLRKDHYDIVASCSTDTIKLYGGEKWDRDSFEEEVKKLNLTDSQAVELATLFGSSASKVLEYITEQPDTSERYELGVLNYCIDEEMVLSPSDYFVRRTGNLYFDIDRVRALKDLVIDFMYNKLQWSDSRRTEFVQNLNLELAQASEFPKNHQP